MDPGNFLAELKRRNVYKVAVTYAVVAWLLIQAAAILFPTYEAPAWVMKVFVAIVALGFPIALVIGWAFEMTPEGIKRFDDAAEPPHQHVRRGWIYLVVVSVALAISLFFVGRYTASHRAAADAITGKSIAVLPLLNESGDPEDEYFSDGLSEELIAALAQVRELKVIGRSSSFRFKERQEDSKTIGEKLGVATL